jgi:tellurite methyltransferase
MDERNIFWDELHGRKELTTLPPPDIMLRDYHSLISPGKVLDLGAGYGRNGLFFSAMGFDVTIADISAVAIAKGKKIAGELGLNAQFMTATADSLTEKDTYNLVICASLLQFFLEPQRQLIVEKIFDALTEGGFVYFSSFSTDDDSFKRYKKSLNQLEKNTFDLETSGRQIAHYFTEKEVLKLFKAFHPFILTKGWHYDNAVKGYVGVINYLGIKV